MPTATTVTTALTAAGPPDVLQAILDLVQARGLQAGDRLPPIRELAGRLGVKPSLVRDVLLQAQTRGLVRILPRAGAVLRVPLPQAGAAAPDGEGPVPVALQLVTSQGEPNLLHLLDARRLIEVELAARAAERRRLEDLLPVRRALEAMLELPADAPRGDYVNHDVRFHVEIARLAGNSILFGVQRSLMDLLRPHLNELPATRERRALTDRSHTAIYSALVAGDAEQARAEMRQHLSLAYDGLLRDLQQTPVVNGGKAPTGRNGSAGRRS